MPRVVEVIKSRVETLSQSKKLPAGMSAETIGPGKSRSRRNHAAVDGGATDASKGGNLMDAVSKANSAKVKAAEVLTLLKMPVPEALKG